ncbi:flavin reductase [uncultured Stenotrophomonas sp.]|uniref:flavin reductase family protein n=1 Tax=uncultured Stenotrophomonas sp. TaxID=165438 RepID=UPI0025F8FFE4|nr:flavin reductase [uncultured Stenotrophomonas sp.]
MKIPSFQRRRITPSVLYPGTPVLLMTTLNPDGSSNISPLSSFWALGNRVVLGLGTQGQGYRNLQLRNECVLNFPCSAQATQVEAIARATGRDPVPEAKQEMGYMHVHDKFALGGFSAEPSAQVAPASIAECPLQVEVTVMAMHPPSDDDGQGFVIVEGRVRCVHAHEAITVAGTQHIDASRWKPLIYLFRHYLGVGEPVGRNFRAQAAARDRA